MIEFYQVVGGGINPMKGDPSALGTIPTAGFRYCEPVRTSSGFGWYMFLPQQLGVVYEQGNVFWSLDDFETRHLLVDAIQYPGFSSAFDEAAPEGIKGYSPPFLSRTNDDDILQIWTGAFIRTRKEVSLWVRGPVNVGRQRNCEVLEGVVDTDWWFGPLFANVRIFHEDVPVIFRREKPFLQILPFDKALSAEFAQSEPMVVEGLEKMPDEAWQAYDDTIVKRMKRQRPAGEYAVKARKAAAPKK